MKKIKAKKMPDLVMVDWLDAYVTDDDKAELDDVTKHYTRSIGWLVKKDKNYLYLSHFFDGLAHEFGSPFTAIPKGMLKNKWVLKTNEPNKKRGKK